MKFWSSCLCVLIGSQVCSTALTFIQCWGSNPDRQASHEPGKHSTGHSHLPRPIRVSRGLREVGCEIWRNFASHLLDSQHLYSGHDGQCIAHKLQASLVFAVHFALAPPSPGPWPASREPTCIKYDLKRQSRMFVP